MGWEGVMTCHFTQAGWIARRTWADGSSSVAREGGETETSCGRLAPVFGDGMAYRSHVDIYNASSVYSWKKPVGW